MTKDSSQTLLVFAATLVLTSCGIEGLFGPVEPEEVTVTLTVSGGIAGVGYGVVLDGAAGEARGSCGLCGVSQRQLVVPLSSAQIAALAQSLDDSGVLGMNGTDFGTQCCDQFYVDLTYERGELSTHVRGTQGLLPLELLWPLRLLTALAHGSVPVLVSPDTRDTDWPRDPYTLGEVVVEGLTITAEVTYGGGCDRHRMDLVVWGGWMESFPVQIEALVTHDDSDDPCDGLLTESRRFDLSPLARAYVEQYGDSGPERPTIILRLWDPASGSARLVEVGL